MRKVLIFLLTAIVTLSLVACGESSSLNDSKAECNIFGKWVVGPYYNGFYAFTLEFNEDNTVTYYTDNDKTVVKGTYEIDGGDIVMNIFGHKYRCPILEKDGVEYFEEFYHVFCKEEAYDSFYEDVVVSIENLYDYFEVNTVLKESYNEFNELQVEICNYLQLKDDFLDRYAFLKGALKTEYYESELEFVYDLEKKEFISFESNKGSSLDDNFIVNDYYKGRGFPLCFGNYSTNDYIINDNLISSVDKRSFSIKEIIDAKITICFYK